MADISLTFPSLNFSAQVGDLIYYTSTEDDAGGTDNGSAMLQSGGFTVAEELDVQWLGTIKQVITGVSSSGATVSGGTHLTIICELVSSNNPIPTTNNYFFFRKDGKFNTSSVRGYYAEVEFKNNNNRHAEMFACSCNITESSK